MYLLSNMANCKQITLFHYGTNNEQWISQQASLKMRTSKSKTFRDPSRCTGGRSSQLFWYSFFLCLFYLVFFEARTCNMVLPLVLCTTAWWVWTHVFDFMYRFPDTCQCSCFFSQKPTQKKSAGAMIKMYLTWISHWGHYFLFYPHRLELAQQWKRLRTFDSNEYKDGKHTLARFFLYLL